MLNRQAPSPPNYGPLIAQMEKNFEQQANEFKRQAQQNGEKLDKLLEQVLIEAPKRYLDLASYERRHEALDKRIEIAEADIKAINERINSLHEGSMSFVNQTFTEIRTTITSAIAALEDKLDKKQSKKSGILWQASIVFGSVLAGGLFQVLVGTWMHLPH